MEKTSFQYEIPVPCQKNLHLCTGLFTGMIHCLSYLSYTLMHVKSNMECAWLHIMSHSSLVHLGQCVHPQRIVNGFNLLPSGD